MNAAKWTGLALLLVAVVGVAVWNMAAPGPMAGYAGSNGAVAMGSNGGPATDDAPRANPPNADRSFFDRMGQWCQQMWGRMTGWMRGMTGGGMHGHGPGMMGRGMPDRGWTHDGRTPQDGPTSAAPSSNPAETTTVQMDNFAFEPQTIRVQAGQTVTWINRDQVGHNVVFDETGQAGPMLNQGQQWSHTFEEPGTYTYDCGPHPSMTGTVVVE